MPAAEKAGRNDQSALRHDYRRQPIGTYLLTAFVIGTRKRPLDPHLFINRDKGQMVL